jgi:uncharacterized protein YifN (PemK superfamily)
MKIIFKYNDGTLLGEVTHSNFSEIALPAFKQDSHDVFVKHNFTKYKGVLNWQVKNVIIDNDAVYISLDESDFSASVAEFSASQNKDAGYYLKPYQIVDVEFGFYSELFDGHNAPQTNNRVGNGLIKGEMHKRRPCIVLREHRGCVQVIPLSTKIKLAHDPLNIEISPESFSSLAARYREKPSFALLNMIQTVSTHRVFPPRNTRSKYEHKYHQYKITQSDRDLIKTALAEQYNQDITSRIAVLKTELEKNKQEKTKLLTTKNKILDEKRILSDEVDKLQAFILKFGREMMGNEKTLDEVLKYYP